MVSSNNSHGKSVECCIFLQTKTVAAVTEFPDRVPTTSRLQHSCAAIWTGLQQSVLLRETVAVLKSHPCQNSFLQSHPGTESSASVLWIRKDSCSWKVRKKKRIQLIAPVSPWEFQWQFIHRVALCPLFPDQIGINLEMLVFVEGENQIPWEKPLMWDENQ